MLSNRGYDRIYLQSKALRLSLLASCFGPTVSVRKFVRQTSRENIAGGRKDKKSFEQPVEKVADKKICETKYSVTSLSSLTSREAEYKFSGLLEELLSP